VFTLPSGGMDDTVSSHRKIMGACQRNDGEEAERLIIDDLRLTYRSFVDSFADNK
jgi:DNA-binding GntR family transcriptional regulator